MPDQVFNSTEREASDRSGSSLRLPSGGGSISPIGERFRANPATGTAGFSIPLPISPARGLTAELSLIYDSGSGMSPFGVGWSVNATAIRRRTSRRIPEYDNQTDTFAFADGEDLVPVADEADDAPSSAQEQGKTFDIRRFLPRVEGAYARIEMWVDRGSGESHWRLWSGSNTVTILGQSADARLADPADPNRVFAWHVEREFDAFGNLTVYEYKPEDTSGVDLNEVSEAHRASTAPVGRYLKRVRYGNRPPFDGNAPNPRDFCFTLLFDYGEHDRDNPSDREVSSWPVRSDPFSRWDAGFERRAWRRCERVILLHDFPELGNEPEPVRALELRYENAANGMALLSDVRSVGYLRDDAGILRSEARPRIRFGYRDLVLGGDTKAVMSVDGRDVEHAAGPAGWRWQDLLSEGLPGLLRERAGALSYRRNLGDGRLGDEKALASQSSLSGLDSAVVVQDLDGEGRKSLVVRAPGVAARGRVGPESRVGVMTRIAQVPTVGTAHPQMRAVDLDGDGLGDLLQTDGEHLYWYPGRGGAGHRAPRRVAFPLRGARATGFLFGDKLGRIFVADMSGDGLTDVVRIENGRVWYWPNAGHGRFGSRIEMRDAPLLDRPDRFDPGRIRLGDIDGSGAADLIYLGGGAPGVWLNRSGNGWSARQEIDSPFPSGPPPAEIDLVDVAGTGTAALVWAANADAVGRSQIRFLELTGGRKPYLLETVRNGMGAETRLDYAPSTEFYLNDAAAGTPWLTRLPFPVHCLTRVEQTDHVTGLTLATVYSYHHGAFDPFDRDFRGFARVDQVDTETLAETGAGAPGRPFYQPPVLTRTWFHTGVAAETGDLHEALAGEYYDHPALPRAPAQIAFPETLATRDWRETQRAMRGAVLRREVHALDDGPLMEHPLSIEMPQYRVDLLQPAPAGAELDGDAMSVVRRLDAGNVSYLLDRRPEDPRVTQSLVLEWNAYGQPLRTAEIALPRLAQNPDVPASVAAAQAVPRVVVAEHVLTAPRMADDMAVPTALWATGATRNLPRTVESKTAEVAGLTLAATITADALDAALSDAVEVDYSDPPATGVARRTLTRARTRYLADDLSGPLPLGRDSGLGLIQRTERLAFTAPTLAALFGARVDDDAMAAAGYLRSEDADGVPDAGYWASSAEPIHAVDAASRFYVPVGSRDPFGAETRLDLDAHFLLPVREVDAAGQETVAINDYRVLGPRAVRDPNLNWTVARFDALGQVTATALMGKVPSTDAPTGVEPCEGDTLDHPSMAYRYDLDAWDNGFGPVRATATAYETHFHQAPPAAERLSLIRHVYSDGTGNAVLTKAQATPGPAYEIGPDDTLREVDTSLMSPPALRWIGNGRTVYNNKGQPLRTFEPYFSTSPDYDDDPRLLERGASTLSFYDAADRPIGAFRADRTWTKIDVSPWRTESWDAADTCLIADPALDPVTGAHFAGLPPEDVHPLWHAARAGGALGPEAAAAAAASAEHADTPATAHVDPLSRTIRAEAMPDPATVLASETALDIEGNVLAVTDARGNRVMSFGYGMLPGGDDGKAPLRISSTDAGERRVLPDALGREHREWDDRGHALRVERDRAGRAVARWLSTDGGPERRVGAVEFGDAEPDAAARNLLGRTVRTWDQSGLAEVLAFDFKGNPLETEGRFARPVAPDEVIDWGADASSREGDLLPEAFRATAAFDALNRMTESVAPHTAAMTPSVTRASFDRGGGLEQVRVAAPGMAETVMVDRITYDAKGQRQSVHYGNGVATEYAYDPLTHRLSRLTTTREGDGAVLQDLVFTYDAVGNITDQRDLAQQTIFFANQAVEPHATYRHDALYRLTEATGREHADQAARPDWQTGWAGRPHPEDGARMRTYTQRFTYDAAGNITRIRHVAGAGSWTRDMGYAAGSNRLEWTEIGPDPREHFSHNAHGSLAGMGHLAALDWDFAERLARVDKGSEGHAEYSYDAAGGRVRKRWVHPDGRIEERLDFGGFELYREWRDETLLLERETLHVSDDAGRIALVETLTVENGVRLAAPAPLTRYQLGNHLGSAVLELDDAGAVISYEEYHPYGTTAFHSVAADREVPAKRYRYTGKERDEETGFTYHGARYYAPWLARWTAADPIGIADGLNVYAYVGGRPVRSIDPDGQSDHNMVYDCCERLATPPGLNLANAYERPPSFDLQMPDIKGGQGMQPSAQASETQSYTFLDFLMVRAVGVYGLIYGLTWAAGTNDVAAGAVDDFSFYTTHAMRTRHFPEYHEEIDYEGQDYYVGTWIGYGAQTGVFALAGGGTVGLGRAVAGSMVDDAAFAVVLYEQPAYAAGGGGGGGGGPKRPLLSALWAVDISSSMQKATRRSPSGNTLVQMPITRSDGRVQNYWVRSSMPMRSTSSAAEQLAINQANGYALAYAKWASLKMYGLDVLWEVRMFGGARRMDLVLPPQKHVPRWTGIEVKHGQSFYGGRQQMWDTIAQDQFYWDIFVSRGSVIFE